MISVDKSKVAKPDILNDAKIGKQLQNIVFEPKPSEKIGTTYRSPKVKEALTELYAFEEDYVKGAKCGYCETKIDPAMTTEEVEHFRSKGNVKTLTLDKNGEVVRKENGNIEVLEITHKGYFWLCYEWTNLLISCGACNRHKSTFFPLKDETTRVSDDLLLEGFLKNDTFIFEKFRADSIKFQQEKRLLLHPELDKVEEHLVFFPNGKIEGLTVEGKTSIIIYGLNRNSLINARKNIVQKLYKDLLIAIAEDYQKDKEALKKFFNRQIKDLDNPKRIYSRFGYFIKTYFDWFIIEQFRADNLIFFAEIIKEEYAFWQSENNKKD